MPIVADAAVAVRADMARFGPDLKAGTDVPIKSLGQRIKGVFSPQNLALGAAALGGLVVAGLANATKALIDIERLNAQTDAVIRSTGAAANVTRQQIEDAAEAAEQATTIERETVQEAQNMLLTFTNIRNELGEGNDIFNQATEAVLDMSVALGTDATSASVMLGKALNDPVKGITAMTRAGIQFTDQQKEMIKAMVEAGDLLGAQTIILAELETQFGGSAEAFANTTAGRVQRFQNDVGNMFESIVVGATKVADFLGTEVDLWPFDGPKLAAEAGVTAGQTMDSYAQTIYGGRMRVTAAVTTALHDPIVDALLGGKEEAERIASETPGGIAQALLDNQFSVEDAMAEIERVAAEALHPMIERAQIIGFLASSDLAKRLRSGIPAVSAAAQAVKQAAEDRLAVLSGEAFFWGLNSAQSYAAGLNAGYGYVRTAAGTLAAATRNQIGINSEPKDHSSPLYGITKWGGNIADELAGGMLRGLGGVRGAARVLAAGLVPGLPGGMGAVTIGGGTVGGGGGNTYNVSVETLPQYPTLADIGGELRRLGEMGKLPGSKS